jgi:hypothetical protein
MFGVGGTRPKVRSQLIVWWICLSLFVIFVGYVLFRNLVHG